MKSLGFTLIELLISVAIMSLITGSGLAAYRNMEGRHKLKQAGSSLQSQLRLIQQKALASEKPAECGLNSLLGYAVEYVNESSYSVVAVCNEIIITPNQVNLPKGIVFSQEFFPSRIFFRVLQAEVEGSQTINLTNGKEKYSVIIEANGVIRSDFAEN